MTSHRPDRVQLFVDMIVNEHKTMTAQRRVKAIHMFNKIPVTTPMIQKLQGIEDDVDFTPAVEDKRQQMYEDTEKTLTKAVDAGVATVDDLCRWLHIDPSSSTHDIIDHAHYYARMGSRKAA